MISLVAAAWTIADRRVDSFIGWNRAAFEEVGVELVLVSDRDLGRPEPWVCSPVYPLEQPVFSIPRTVNYGIRRAAGDIVVKTDVDIIFTAEILRLIGSYVRPGRGMVGICANIKKPEHAAAADWGRISKRHRGRGACFAMCREDWEALRGYNENITGWGADDNDMWLRASSRFDMVESRDQPVFHVAHPNRKNAEMFPNCGSKNLKISRKGCSNPENWGDPLSELDQAREGGGEDVAED
jgi:hypothetical protein